MEGNHSRPLHADERKSNPSEVIPPWPPSRILPLPLKVACTPQILIQTVRVLALVNLSPLGLSRQRPLQIPCPNYAETVPATTSHRPSHGSCVPHPIQIVPYVSVPFDQNIKHGHVPPSSHRLRPISAMSLARNFHNAAGRYFTSSVSRNGQKRVSTPSSRPGALVVRYAPANGDVPGVRCPGRTSQQRTGKRRLCIQTVIELQGLLRCFCHRKANPAPPRLSTPHSCAQPCSRPRSPRCEHSCPLPCHPGPCPPCAITVEKSCFCGGQVRRAKCSVFGSSQSGFFACQNVCARPLSCKNPTHTCKERCHPGPCSPCTATVQMRCWCGKETKVVECSQVKSEDVIDCVVLNKGDESQESWIGMFCCRKTCDR